MRSKAQHCKSACKSRNCSQYFKCCQVSERVFSSTGYRRGQNGSPGAKWAALPTRWSHGGDAGAIAGWGWCWGGGVLEPRRGTPEPRRGGCWSHGGECWGSRLHCRGQRDPRAGGAHRSTPGSAPPAPTTCSRTPAARGPRCTARRPRTPAPHLRG